MCIRDRADASGAPHRNRTRIVTNCEQLVEALKSRQCDRSHKRSWVIGGAKVSRRAGHYPPKMAEAAVGTALAAGRQRLSLIHI
eukprot:3369312-Alexandrium_andersonii.AAC.1